MKSRAERERWDRLADQVALATIAKLTDDRALIWAEDSVGRVMEVRISQDSIGWIARWVKSPPRCEEADTLPELARRIVREWDVREVSA